MKIWIQSNTALHTDKSWRAYAGALETHLERVKRPGTALHCAGVEKMESNVEGSAFQRHVNVRQILELGFQAQSSGYDAFVMVGMGTAGYEELRDALSIPVVYAESVAWNFAVWQYRRFGLVAHNPTVYFRRVEQIRVHGSLDLFVPGDYCNLPAKRILDAFADPQPTIALLEASAAAAVRNGARVLIADFNVLNDLFVAAGVKELHGVPIMDVAGVSLKAAEFLVDARRAGVLDVHGAGI